MRLLGKQFQKFLRKSFERKKKHQNAKIFFSRIIIAFVVSCLLNFILLVGFGLVYVFVRLNFFS